MQYYMNTVKIKEGLFSVRTNYNEFQILSDVNKGIGIYLMCPSGSLIKTYKHQKIEMALNWIMKNYTNFQNI